MACVTHVVTIDEVARQLGENLELIELVSANSDNIDYGETIWVDNGTEVSGGGTAPAFSLTA
jgi:hypothetical protein